MPLFACFMWNYMQLYELLHINAYFFGKKSCFEQIRLAKWRVA